MDHELSPELQKLKVKCEKLALAGKHEKFQKLLYRKAAILTNIQLSDHHVVSIEQAIKDAAREKIVLNDCHYRGGWSELHRLRADLLELSKELITRSVIDF